MKKLVFAIFVFSVLSVIFETAHAEFLVGGYLTNDGPAVSGNIVVWLDSRNGGCSIYGYDISTSTEFPIRTDQLWRDDIDISGNVVVWRGIDYEIYGYDISTSTEFPICTAPGIHRLNPAISGNIVVWDDYRNGNYDIYGYDISTSTEFPIRTDTGSQRYPDISGNIVVWQDDRNGNGDIYGYNLDTATEFSICTDTNSQYYPAIDGNIVVWRDYRNGNWDIYGYDISTSTEFPICTEPHSQENPAVDGNIVVWQDHRNRNNDIYGYDISTSTEFPITKMPEGQTRPDISGNIVVWGQGGNVYGLNLLSGNNECISAIEVYTDIPYTGSIIGSNGFDCSSCGYNDIDDVWHRFVAPASADYAIGLCSSDFDTTLAVYDNCWGTEIVCNDDYCGKQSQVLLKTRAGQNYLIRVAGYDGNEGNYTLNITECTMLKSDLNGDCKVNFEDLAKMASEWLKDGTK